MDKYDVIIIGAGIAGLAAAHELHAAGKNILVLEAQGYIGGRVKTIRERGIVESGAEFVHGEHAATWSIIEAAGIETVEWKSPDGSPFQRLYGEGGGIVEQDPSITGEANQLRKAAYEYEGKDKSLEEFLLTSNASETVQTIVGSSIATLEATDPDSLSVLGLATAERFASNGHRNFFLPNGYDQVVETLAQGLEIKVNHPVTQIEWNPDQVVVHCATGESFTAAKLIFTVSLGVLQGNGIRFVPELPVDFATAVHAIGFGNVTKTTLWIDGPVAEFQILTGRHGINFWQRTFGTETVLVGYTGGSRSTELTALSKEEAIAETIRALEDTLDPGIASHITHAHHFTWSDNPYVGGAYSYPKVGMGDAHSILQKPIGSRIYYAGEATHAKGNAATVHGAIEEGRRAARTILETV